MVILKGIVSVFVGFAGGLAVGSGFVAFLSVLGVIPRLVQLSRKREFMHQIEQGTVLGAIVGCFISFSNQYVFLPYFLIAMIGLFSGIFIGMLAAALTEVLNVWPILAKRVGVQKKIIYLLMAIAFGKVFGSLFHWVYYYP